MHEEGLYLGGMRRREQCPNTSESVTAKNRPGDRRFDSDAVPPRHSGSGAGAGEMHLHSDACEYEGKGKGHYLIEARYKFAGDFRHYGKHTKDAAEVKRIFRKFAEGVSPNTPGWDDITERMDAVTA